MPHYLTPLYQPHPRPVGSARTRIAPKTALFGLESTAPVLGTTPDPKPRHCTGTGLRQALECLRPAALAAGYSASSRKIPIWRPRTQRCSWPNRARRSPRSWLAECPASAL